jgi:predicted DNA repair protein MutK
VNKVILVPAALAISAFAPWAITPLLMLGGAFLCYEGFEKLAHRFMHSKVEDEAHHEALSRALADPQVDVVALEKQKIKGAVRTDFILSAEIIVISLGTVAQASFAQRLGVLVGIALIMTVGVYGLVAGIVKLDDLGMWLARKGSAAAQAVGRGILRAAPWLMKALSIAGTAAMFLVGGSILLHGIGPLAHAIEDGLHPLGGMVGIVVGMLADALVGIVAGALVLALVSVGRRFAVRRAPA